MGEARRLRIAFTDIASTNWAAGSHYYQNLIFALKSLEPERSPEILILERRNRWVDASYNTYSSLVAKTLVEPPEVPVIPPEFVERQVIRIQKRLRLYQLPPPPVPALITYLREQHVDAVFGYTEEVDLGPNFSIPLLAWIPDLEHLRLPEMWTSAQLQALHGLVPRVAKNATRVVMSSMNGLADMRQFIPEAANKTRVLHFVAQVPAEAYAQDAGRMCNIYHLPQRFVYLPNQFWKHKNHGLVIDALEQLHAHHPEIIVVCSGNTTDMRSPLYFGQLLEKVSRLGLRENFIVLGWVPHEHIFQLIRQALAVLQPSLFEGWSTTVEEAKSLGKGLILSDLPVHREQAPAKSDYFNPKDATALAAALVRAYETRLPGPDRDLEKQAQAELPRRSREFAECFIGIVNEAVSSLA